MAKSGSLSADNSALAPTVAALPKISRSIPVTIPAATQVNGQVSPAEIPVTFAGDRFYVRVASAEIYVQTVRAGSVGVANAFSSGQGQPVSGGFETLQISNYNLFPVVALIWIGFNDFINDQLVLDSVTNDSVLYPTYPVPNAATVVQIRDLSGQTFLDLNGKKWNALFRVAILVFNLDTGVTAKLFKVGGSGVSPAGGIIYPAPLPIRFDFSGDFDINLGGAAINMIVSEIYSAFAS